MNRPLIITIGIAILLLILGIWLYLFLFGTPDDSGEVFANLGFTPGGQQTTITPPEDSAPIEALVDTTTGKLRQLTTRPVAGFMATTTATGEAVRYAERGTGHVYEIDLATGVETIISRTTIPQTAEAVFAPNATAVALTAYANYSSQSMVGTIENGALTNVALEPGAENIAFLDDSTVLYTIVRDGATTGYRQSLSNSSRSEVFTFNFTNLDVGWGRELSETYIATKPAANLSGFVYTIVDNTVTPATASARGLSAFYHNEALVASYQVENEFVSAYAPKVGSRVKLPVLALKEKCTFDAFNPTYVWCGAGISTVSGDTVAAWYKGTYQFSDNLWLIDLKNQSAALSVSPPVEIGRSLDMVDLQINTTGTAIMFKHKNDQTLWLYDVLAS